MFYDLERPINFVELVKSILESDGIFHLEVAYLPEIVKTFHMTLFVKNIMNIILFYLCLIFLKKQI